MVEARASAEWASMSASRMWISEMRCASVACLGLRHQRRALAIGAEHHVEDGDLARCDFLLDAADPRPGMDRDGAAIGRDLALDQPEERGLARSVLAHEAGLGSGGQHDGGALEERTALDAVGEVVDGEHDGGVVR